MRIGSESKVREERKKKGERKGSDAKERKQEEEKERKGNKTEEERERREEGKGGEYEGEEGRERGRGTRKEGRNRREGLRERKGRQGRGWAGGWRAQQLSGPLTTTHSWTFNNDAAHENMHIPPSKVSRRRRRSARREIHSAIN